MKGKRVWVALIASAVVCLGVRTLLLRQNTDQQETLVITIPESGLIRNIDMNYYTRWLETKTDLNLVFHIIPETYGADYFEQVFTSSNLKTDIVFNRQSDETSFFTYERVEAFGEKGYIIPLNRFITKETNFQKITDNFSDYDLQAQISSADGNLYFFPKLDASARARWNQSYWINRNWLQRLKLPLPQTTGDLQELLLTFKAKDPNNNELADEVCFAGSNVCDYLVNSFVYNDPANMRMFVSDGVVRFSPTTSEWRQAMQYLHELYENDVLTSFSSSLNGRALTELASNPSNVLGGFTSADISDVIHPTCTEIVNNFVSLSPIKGPLGKAYSVVKTPAPQVGAVISSTCKNPQKAFELLDLMLSEEAFLIAHYGEEGVDWSWADVGDLDSYGEKAVIKIRNQLDNVPQNKNFAGLGPLYVYPQYADHITWSGFDPEYLNARAYLSQLQDVPSETLGLITLKGENKKELHALKEMIEQYTLDNMKAFISGEKNVNDDNAWEEYLRGFGQFDIELLISEVQLEYDAAASWRKERMQ